MRKIAGREGTYDISQRPVRDALTFLSEQVTGVDGWDRRTPGLLPRA